MSTKEETKASQRAANRKWYKNNKEARNKARREKYATDTDYRNKIVKGAKAYRDRGARLGDEELYRTVNGERVRVYRLGSIGDRLGISPQTIRQWEAKGYIPKATIDSSHRMYTKTQVSLIERVAESNLSKRISKTDTKAQENFKEVVEYVKSNW